jgi:hypothetical protein
MSIKYNGKTIIESYGKLMVGDNGNFWVGDTDLGVKAKSDVHTVTEQEFYTCIEPGVYFVIIPKGSLLTLAMYYIDTNGSKRVITNTNYNIETPSDIDAAINDVIVANNATWSSAKITSFVASEIDKYVAEQPRDLEFKWVGTKLGVRQQGRGDYLFTDLIGKQGLDGIDGSSVVGARMDDQGNLILTIQDADDADENSKFLALENGVFTRENLLALVNDIKKLKNNIKNIINAPFSAHFALPVVDTAYHQVYSTTGHGQISVNVNKFTGVIKLTIDGDVSEVSVSSVGETANIAQLGTGVFKVINATDALSGAYTIDIPFNESINVEMKVTQRDINITPRVMVKGYCYSE